VLAREDKARVLDTVRSCDLWVTGSVAVEHCRYAPQIVSWNYVVVGSRRARSWRRSWRRAVYIIYDTEAADVFSPA
jgi:hypothetical protein